MIELCDYIYYNYPNLKNKVQYWQLLSLLDRNEDKVITVKEGDKFKGAGIYLKLSDNSFEDLKLISKYGTRKEIKEFLSLPLNMALFLQEKGDNIHFFILLADSFHTIRKGLREVIKRENAKNVSWFDIETYKLKVFKIERELCKV